MSEHEMRERITRLEAVVGQDSSSGIRGEIEEIRESLKEIYERIRAFEMRFYTIAGGVAVAVWIIEKVWK